LEMMKKGNIVHLPEDLVVEILTRVPAVSLRRLRSTSKGWNALIKDGRFAKKHFANAPRQSLVIMLIDYRVYLVSTNLHRIENDKAAPSAKVKQGGSNPEIPTRNQTHML
ncbi:F-box-like domain superfamily, partial [Arabidopsis thaliana x Arabidopsis arenosa]